MPTPFRASYSLGALPALFISSFHLPFRGKRGHPLTDAGTELTEMKVFARDACRGEPERQDPMRLGPAEPTVCTALFSNLDILSTPNFQDHRNGPCCLRSTSRASPSEVLGDCWIWFLPSMLSNGPPTMTPLLSAPVQLLRLVLNMDTIHRTDKHLYEIPKYQNTQGKGRTPALCSDLNRKA